MEKLVLLRHLHSCADAMKAFCNRKTAQVAEAAAQDIAAMNAAISAKQNALTGRPGQVVGFGADGKPEAQAPPATGVTSFKARSGAVTPQKGDYTAQQVGALPITGGTMEGDVEIPWGKNVSFGLDIPGIGGLAFSPDPDRNIDKAHFGFVDDADRWGEEVVRIGGIAVPKYNDEVANKKYVDTLRPRFSRVAVGPSFTNVLNMAPFNAGVVLAAQADKHGFVFMGGSVEATLYINGSQQFSIIVRKNGAFLQAKSDARLTDVTFIFIGM